MLKYYDVKMNFYDENSKPIKKLTEQEIDEVTQTFKESIKNGNSEFQCETTLVVLDGEVVNE